MTRMPSKTSSSEVTPIAVMSSLMPISVISISLLFLRILLFGVIVTCLRPVVPSGRVVLIEIEF